MNAALKKALGALHLLDEGGSTVLNIDVRGGTPVLIIDRPPPFVVGSVVVRRTNGARREILRAARFHGAQLEWTHYEPRPLLVSSGAA